MEILDHLTGTSKEIGRRRGEAHRSLIREHLERLKFLAFTANPGLNPDDTIAQFVAGTGYLKAAEQWSPQLLEEVRGISEGSNIPFNNIFAMSCLDELWRYSQSHTGQPIFACSSMGCFREGSIPALMGQNLDTEYISKNLAVVLHIQGNEQPESYIVCHASNLGWMGVNRSPLGVCVNTLHLRSNRHGLPVQFVAREILRKHSLSDAVDFLTHVRQGAAQNFMVGDDERVLDFEGSAKGVVQYVPYEGARRVYHTNHPFVNDDHIPRYPVFYQNSLDRYRYLEFRLKDPSKPIDLENIKGILRSHTGPICRHTDHSPEAAATWVSVIYSLSNPPELYVAEGNPCDREYQRFTFRE